MKRGWRGKWIAISLGLLVSLPVNYWSSRMTPVWSVAAPEPICDLNLAPDGRTVVTIHGPEVKPPANMRTFSEGEAYVAKPVITHWDLASGRKLTEIPVNTNALSPGFCFCIWNAGSNQYQLEPTQRRYWGGDPGGAPLNNVFIDWRTGQPLTEPIALSGYCDMKIDLHAEFVWIGSGRYANSNICELRSRRTTEVLRTWNPTEIEDAAFSPSGDQLAVLRKVPQSPTGEYELRIYRLPDCTEEAVWKIPSEVDPQFYSLRWDDLLSSTEFHGSINAAHDHREWKRHAWKIGAGGLSEVDPGPRRFEEILHVEDDEYRTIHRRGSRMFEFRSMNFRQRTTYETPWWRHPIQKLMVKTFFKKTYWPLTIVQLDPVTQKPLHTPVQIECWPVIAWDSDLVLSLDSQRTTLRAYRFPPLPRLHWFWSVIGGGVTAIAVQRLFRLRANRVAALPSAGCHGQNWLRSEFPGEPPIFKSDVAIAAP